MAQDATGTFGAGGAIGAVEALRQLIADRIAEQDRQRRALVEDRNFGLQNRQLDLQTQLRGGQLAESIRNHTLADNERQDTADQKLNDQIPAGRNIVGGSPVYGRLSRIGAVPETPAAVPMQAPAPPDALAANPDAGPQSLPGTVSDSPSPVVGRLFPKLASFNQQKESDTLARQQAKDQADAADKERLRAEQAARDAEIGRHNKAMENKPVSEQGWTIQQGTVNGQPGWVRINSRTGEVRPVDAKEITPKPPDAIRVKEQDKKSALDTLSQLDQAIENAKDLVGPGEGRFTSLEQMAGSADPRAQALGAKMLLAKMKIDAALGGLRAAASPQILARWDNLLANKVTPEGLKAAVQAIREIIGGSDAPAPGGSRIKSITEIK